MLRTPAALGPPCWPHLRHPAALPSLLPTARVAPLPTCAAPRSRLAPRHAPWRAAAAAAAAGDRLQGAALRRRSAHARTSHGSLRTARSQATPPCGHCACATSAAGRPPPALQVWHLRPGGVFYPRAQFEAALALVPRGGQVTPQPPPAWMLRHATAHHTFRNVYRLRGCRVAHRCSRFLSLSLGPRCWWCLARSTAARGCCWRCRRAR
jgi:hypothetical protein